MKRLIALIFVLNSVSLFGASNICETYGRAYTDLRKGKPFELLNLQNEAFYQHVSYADKEQLPSNYILIDTVYRDGEQHYSKSLLKGQLKSIRTISLYEGHQLTKKKEIIVTTRSVGVAPSEQNFLDMVNTTMVNVILFYNQPNMQLRKIYTEEFSAFLSSLRKRHQLDLTKELKKEINSLVQDTVCGAD